MRGCRRGKDTRRRLARNCISPTALRYETCHPGLPQAGRTVIEPLLRACHFWWYGGFCVSISSCTTGNGANSHARCSQIFPPRSLALFSIPPLSPLPPPVPPLRCLSSARPFILCSRLATSRARCRRLFPSRVTAVIAGGTFQPPRHGPLPPLFLFMTHSPLKFNQPLMEPPAPFQFTTWTQQDGKSHSNIKV